MPIRSPIIDMAAPEPETPAELTGCWGTAGVYGDGSCPELSTVVHCRNCPVYSAAGVRLIDRPLPVNYRQEWTEHFARSRPLTELGTASLVVFRIQNEWLAMPTHNFQEVAERRPIHSLPRRRAAALLGLANVRGELVICISLGHLLQIDQSPTLDSVRRDYQRLLVLQGESNRLAFPVDEVHGPQRFHPQDFKSPPATPPRASARYAQAVVQWQDRTAGLLDPHLIFSTLQRSLS
ncbi:MAG TPA: chemotaxis protein CheW [Candidatus Dormibacteraeota bacterium]|nr:chemotaxis protein CheW [Candidatus Dormibacteraeota bacterium]